MGKERFHFVDADAAGSGVHWLCIWSKEGDCNREVARQVSRTGSLFPSHLHLDVQSEETQSTLACAAPNRWKTARVTQDLPPRHGLFDSLMADMGPEGTLSGPYTDAQAGKSLKSEQTAGTGAVEGGGTRLSRASDIWLHLGKQHQLDECVQSRHFAKLNSQLGPRGEPRCPGTGRRHLWAACGPREAKASGELSQREGQGDGGAGRVCRRQGPAQLQEDMSTAVRPLPARQALPTTLRSHPVPISGPSHSEHQTHPTIARPCPPAVKLYPVFRLDLSHL